MYNLKRYYHIRLEPDRNITRNLLLACLWRTTVLQHMENYKKWFYCLLTEMLQVDAIKTNLIEN